MAEKTSLNKLSRRINDPRKVNFLINPTIYEDFDIIAVGQLKYLKNFTKKHKGSHLIKKSVWNFPLVVVDTFDDISQALDFLKGTSSRRSLAKKVQKQMREKKIALKDLLKDLKRERHRYAKQIHA